MLKIKEIITEPTKLYAGEIFKIKIKAIRYLIHKEIKGLTVSELKKYKISQLKGED